MTGARGLKGEVRLKSFAADPLGLDAYGPLSDDAGRQFVLRALGALKGGQVAARIDGIGDRSAAEALKGTRLYVARDALPDLEEDEYYLFDLVGMTAEDGDGVPLGRVVAADDYGAGVVLDIDCVHGARQVVPFTRAVVPEVDLDARRMVVILPDALVDAPHDEGGEGNGDGND